MGASSTAPVCVCGMSVTCVMRQSTKQLNSRPPKERSAALNEESKHTCLPSNWVGWILALPLNTGAGAYALFEEDIPSYGWIFLWHSVYWLCSSLSHQLGWISVGLCAVAGLVVPIIGVQEVPVRLMYGMASLTHGVRLIHMVHHRDHFAHAGWCYRLAFVHWYHDIRDATALEGAGRVAAMTHIVLQMAGAGALLAAAAMVPVASIAVYMPVLPSNTALVYASSTRLGIAFFALLLLVDAGYRAPLALCGGSLQCTMQQPWQAKSLRDFWAKRWNLTIQRMLKDVVYQPAIDSGCTRSVAVWLTFLASGGLHVYPLLLVGMPVWSVLQMLAFFMLQPVLITVEQLLGLRGTLWVFLSLVSICPLFAHQIRD